MKFRAFSFGRRPELLRNKIDKYLRCQIAFLSEIEIIYGRHGSSFNNEKDMKFASITSFDWSFYDIS